MFNEKAFRALAGVIILPWMIAPLFLDEQIKAAFEAQGLVGLFYPVTYFPWVAGVLFGIYGYFGGWLKSEPYKGQDAKRFLHSMGPFALLLLWAALERLQLGYGFFAWLLVYVTLPLSHYWVSHAPKSRRGFMLLVWSGVCAWLAWVMLSQVSGVSKLPLGWVSLAVLGLIWGVVAARQMSFKQPEAPALRPPKPSGPAGTSTWDEGVSPSRGDVEDVQW